MGRLNLMAVVSIFKKIRFLDEVTDKEVDLNSSGNGNRWWYYFSCFPAGVLMHAITDLVSSLLKVNDAYVAGVNLVVFNIINFAVLCSVSHWHCYKPFKLIGAKAKFMLEVIPMIAAAALHPLFLVYDMYFRLLVGCIAYFHIVLHFMHIAYDISLTDLLLGLVMQFFVYMVKGGLLVRGLALSFCFGLSFYRYMSYCAPSLPVPPKKELEELPC